MHSKAFFHDQIDYQSQHLMVLQWHITERCNWRCTHCYQEHYSAEEELEYSNLLAIKDQFIELLDHLNQLRSPGTVKGHINITGGEPFIRPDFMDLLAAFKADHERYSFGILTNGSFIDAKTAKRLKELGTSYVQVSLEGGLETNDNIRGKGAFETVTSALTNLQEVGVPSIISFTAHRNNFLEFPEVAKLGCRIGVSRVWSDRLIPEGSGSGLTDQLLSREEVKVFFESMYKARGEALKGFCQTEIAMHRALQFLVGGGRPYQCAAGDRLVTIEPNGDLSPCRRMPIRVGNVFETPLRELYTHNELFRELRNKDNIPDACRDCIFAKQCRGGLRCLSYAITGSPFNADPGCWLRKQQRKEDIT